MVAVNVVAVDVGSLLNIGWWHAGTSGQSSSGRDLDGLVDVVATDLQRGELVAPGFEAPLFIPYPRRAEGLNRQRVGERGRPWCAGAGTGALALGIQQAAYVFASLAARIHPRVSFVSRSLADGAAELLIWEAFVSGDAKDRSALDPHVDDARLAVVEFQRRFDAGDLWSDIAEPTVLNLAAAAGLATDTSLLKQSCVVVRPAAFGAVV